MLTHMYVYNYVCHCTANMLSGNQEIMEYMAQNLMHYMNPTSLLPQLMKHGLLTEEDAGQCICMYVYAYVLCTCTCNFLYPWGFVSTMFVT